jgi:hypothetical protein
MKSRVPPLAGLGTNFVSQNSEVVMVKRAIFLAGVAVFVSCFALFYVFAEEGAEDLKIKLRDLRIKKTEITDKYNQELQKINKASDERIGQLKVDFHKARNECLKDKQEKGDALRETYKQDVSPLINEERVVLEKIGGSEGMNFAKPKARSGK